MPFERARDIWGVGLATEGAGPCESSWVRTTQSVTVIPKRLPTSVPGTTSPDEYVAHLCFTFVCDGAVMLEYLCHLLSRKGVRVDSRPPQILSTPSPRGTMAPSEIRTLSSFSIDPIVSASGDWRKRVHASVVYVRDLTSSCKEPEDF